MASEPSQPWPSKPRKQKRTPESLLETVLKREQASKNAAEEWKDALKRSGNESGPSHLYQDDLRAAELAVRVYLGRVRRQ